MQCNTKLRILILVVAVLAMGQSAHSMDTVTLVPGFSPDNYRYAYEYSVLKRALECTVETDGPFEIQYAAEEMSRRRVLIELSKPDSINVHVAATRKEWESEVLPIRIPIFRGLLGYRLFLINEQSVQKFADISDIEDLKQLRAGLVTQWTTTSVLQAAGFRVEPVMDYDLIFKQLEFERVDYFPRGVIEIYDELEIKQSGYPNLCVEPKLALYFPTPCYFFVSPSHPLLADRIRRGLETMVETGELKKMVEEEYGESIQRAKLNSRYVFMIENSLLSDETPFSRKNLWFTP